jgi:2,3-bisphosphoglycerate-independent phosphoglycerate mutase
MKKLIFVILDGVAGRPCEEFEGLTSLEKANTPNLDKLAKAGKTGEIRVIDEKTPPQTDNGMIALFGHDPSVYSKGRGPLEAYGIGLKFNEGDLVLRCNFGTIEDNIITDTRAGRIRGEESKNLVKSVNERVKLESFPVDTNFAHSLNYRSILILHPKEGKLSDQISNTHPGYERKPGYSELPKPRVEKRVFEKCKPLDDKKESKISADLINEFTDKSHQTLKTHEINIERKNNGLKPADIVLMRGAGTSLPKLDNFKQKYGTSWLCIGDTPAERGIARLLGMDILENLPIPLCDNISKHSSIEEIENAVKKDMQVRVNELINHFKDYDCFYVHIKGADPFGHAGLPEAKKKVIEGIDKWFFGEIPVYIYNNTVIAVTSDHCTACSIKAHAADPVPLSISGVDIQADSVEHFGESFCKKGSIGRIKATELMFMLMKSIK